MPYSPYITQITPLFYIVIIFYYYYKIVALLRYYLTARRGVVSSSVELARFNSPGYIGRSSGAVSGQGFEDFGRQVKGGVKKQLCCRSARRCKCAPLFAVHQHFCPLLRPVCDLVAVRVCRRVAVAAAVCLPPQSRRVWRWRNLNGREPGGRKIFLESAMINHGREALLRQGKEHLK